MSLPAATTPPPAASAPRRGVSPCPTLGIIGGGQLAKMLIQAAAQLGCPTVVLERERGGPGVGLATESLTGDWNSPANALALAARADAVTIENEFVDADCLDAIERSGAPLCPTAASVRTVQDKLHQRQALAAAGLPVPRFEPVSNRDDVLASAAKFGWPLLLKKRRNGYDGKGNATLRGPADIDAAWSQLNGEASALYAEAFCPFSMEIAALICRGRDGASVSYPIAETIQRDHICHVVKVPAAIPPETAQRALEIARRAVEAVGGIGCFAVELFLTADGAIFINELAPRVHNSGHYTIEACESSQFENHVRAVLGWPLGSTAMRAPAAVMVNLLGATSGSGRPHGIERALAIPGAHVHVYGKVGSAPGRKMGHVTALGQTVDQALDTARRAAELIRF